MLVTEDMAKISDEKIELVRDLKTVQKEYKAFKGQATVNDRLEKEKKDL